VGMADPTALQTAVAAAQAVEFVGLPEARLNLAQAVIHIALAPKSNAVAKAILEAGADVQQGLAGPVPKHLRDASYAGAARLGHGKGYVYAHDDPAGVVQQQYAPDGLVGKRYYLPSSHGAEARYAERSERIRQILQGGADPAAGLPQVSDRERAETRAGSTTEPAQDSGEERPE
jgi:putative ATPase